MQKLKNLFRWGKQNAPDLPVVESTPEPPSVEQPVEILTESVTVDVVATTPPPQAEIEPEQPVVTQAPLVSQLPCYEHEAEFVESDLAEKFKPTGKKAVAKVENAELISDQTLIRPVLQIEKFASIIFSTTQAKDLSKERSKQWVTRFEDGSEMLQAIIINPWRNRRVTVSEHKAFLAAQSIYERNGADERGNVRTSAREFLRELRLQIGGKQWESQKERLRRLRFSSLEFKNLFTNPDGSYINALTGMTIFEHLKILEKGEREKGQQFEAHIEFRFHEAIREALTNQKLTKPTQLDVLLSGLSDNAHLVYSYLDPILANRAPYKPYERDSLHLIYDDLLIEAQRYRQKKGLRKKFLDDVIAEIDGKPLSSGILRCKVTATSDEFDWKIVAHKKPFQEHQKKPLANPTADISAIVSEMIEIVGDANPAQLTRYARLYPRHPVLSQAISEFKADRPDTFSSSPMAFFTVIVHRLAHRHGYDWIKPCGDACPQRMK